MAANPSIPRPDAELLNPTWAGRPANEWYTFWQQLLQFVRENGGNATDIAALEARVAALEAEGATDAVIQGLYSVAVLGSLADGTVTLQLVGDTDTPGNTYYYGTGPAGDKGWFTVASALTATQPGVELVTGADGVTDIRPDDDLEAVEGLSGTGLAARTAANTWTTRTITAGAGISVADGDGVAGNPTVAHADTSSVADLNSNNGGTVFLQDVAITFDTFGHVQTATAGTADVATALAGTFQPLDATLTALAANNWAANSVPIGSGADTVSQVAFAANTFPARASTGNLVAKAITDQALTLLATTSTTNLPEGTNLYFTDARAQAAVVTSSITNGDTTHSPSGDAVFDALATKLTASSVGNGLKIVSNVLSAGEAGDETTGRFLRGDGTWSNTLTEDLIIAGATDPRFRMAGAAGYAYIQGGDPIGDDTGGKLRISGWVGTTADEIRLDTNTLGLNTSSYGGGAGVIGVANATTVPTSNPTGGAIWYVEGGASKARGSSGTTTTFAAAEPHCAHCGADFVNEWENLPRYGYLAVCMRCLARGRVSWAEQKGRWRSYALPAFFAFSAWRAIERRWLRWRYNVRTYA